MNPPVFSEAADLDQGLANNPSMQTLVELLRNFPGLAYRCKNDAKWSALFISYGATELTGYSPSEFLQEKVFYANIVHREDKERVFDEIAEALGENRDFTLEYRIITKSGQEKWVWERGKGVPGPANTQELLGFVTDITLRKKIELELQETQHLFDKAQSVGKLGSWVSDLDRKGNLFWSQETCRIFGVTPASFDKKVETFFKMVHPEDYDLLLSTMRRAMAENTPYHVEHRILRRDGSVRWVREQADIERDEDGKPVRLIGVVQDITEMRQLEEQLRHGQKMEAIGHLAGGLAHDFNNILTIIQGHASLLINSPLEAGRTRQCAQHIMDASDRAAHLTAQLLTFSKKQPIEIKPLKLNEVIHGMTPVLQSLLGADINLELVSSPALPLVEADRGMLEQIVLNLAANARDAMPNGGVLQVALNEETIEPHYARVNTEVVAGRAVCLSVSDCGSGIADEDMPHIFEPFFTTKEQGKGTGLGLATVYAITKQHRGWVTVNSTPGQGTSFRVYFPASDLLADADSAGHPDEQVHGGFQKILVVEDEPLISSLARISLEQVGYQIVEAANAPEALEIWRKEGGAFDMVVTDIVMPESISGLELAGRLILEKPDLPILFTSGYSPDIFGKELELKGKWKFLQKPYTPRDLALAVKQCLNAK